MGIINLINFEQSERLRSQECRHALRDRINVNTSIELIIADQQEKTHIKKNEKCRTRRF